MENYTNATEFEQFLLGKTQAEIFVFIAENSTRKLEESEEQELLSYQTISCNENDCKESLVNFTVELYNAGLFTPDDVPETPEADDDSESSDDSNDNVDSDDYSDSDDESDDESEDIEDTDIERTLRSLKGQINQKANEFKNTSDALEIAKDEIHQLKNVVDNLRAKSLALNEENDRLVDTITRKDNEIAALKAENDALTKVIEEMNSSSYWKKGTTEENTEDVQAFESSEFEVSVKNNAVDELKKTFKSIEKTEDEPVIMSVNNKNFISKNPKELVILAAKATFNGWTVIVKSDGGESQDGVWVSFYTVILA